MMTQGRSFGAKFSISLSVVPVVSSRYRTCPRDASKDPNRMAFFIEGVRFGLLAPDGSEKKSRKNIAFTSTAAPRANSRARTRERTHPPQTHRAATENNVCPGASTCTMAWIISPGMIQMKKNAVVNSFLAEEGWRDSLIEAGAPGWSVRRSTANGTAQIHPITANAFQITSLLICLSQAIIDDPKTADPCPDCATAYPSITLANVRTPPMATMSAASHTPTITASNTHALYTVTHDFVPAHDATNHSGDRNAIRSGRKPLPTPSATAPQYANRLSPFQHRQQQDAVNRENRARLGRSGPSRLACQKTGFTSRRNAADAREPGLLAGQSGWTAAAPSCPVFP